MNEITLQKVKLVMKEYGLNKTSLGRKLNISGQRIGLYLSGKRKPKQDFYDQWEKVFGERLDIIIKKEPEPAATTQLKDKILQMQEDFIHSLKTENAYLREQVNKLLAATNAEKIQSQ